jgi:flagellar motility protein MotE (MotC chaperone)
MIRLARDLRLVPVVLIAVACLLALKVTGLVLDGGYTLIVPTGPERVAPTIVVSSPATRVTPPNLELTASGGAKQSWAQAMFNFPDVTGSVAESKSADRTVTGATKADPAVPAAAAAAKSGPADPPPNPGGSVVPLDGGRLPSTAERAILERLGERRQELDARARELELRENLIKAAEKRMDTRVGEAKEAETRAGTAAQKKEELEAARLKNLVTMYESMKAKDAAKIFDRLDLKILVEVSTQINPRKMSDILAQMTPEAAERLTVELATQASLGKGARPADLPKIEGRPTN